MTDSTCPPQHVDADWIVDAGHLDRWLQAIPPGGVVGVDTEFMRRNTFHPQLALLQLGWGGQRTLVDPLAFDIGQTLQRHLGDRDLVCVMHSAGEDLEVLSSLLPSGPATLFDTQLAAAFAGLGLGLSYRALVSQFCGTDLDKGETRSDWMRRPLSDSQRIYAALDVVYLNTLHQQLQARLHANGHEAWFLEDCARLKLRAGQTEGPEQPQRDMRGAADWPCDKQALLRRVLRWRDRTARALDTPRPWLIDDAQALSLAQNPPGDGDELYQRTRGQRALRAAQRHELLDLLHTPMTADDIASTAAIPAHPQGKAKQTVTAMKQVIDTLATELDLPAGLLCPRKALEEYVVTQAWPAQLQGWRQELLQPRLSPLLADPV